MSDAIASDAPRKVRLLRTIAGWVLCLPIAFVFVMAGFAKVAGRPDMEMEFEHVGLGQWFRYFTGVVELAGAVGVLIPRFSRISALGLAVVMVGAIIAHFTVLSSPATLPAALLVVLLVVAWIRG